MAALAVRIVSIKRTVFQAMQVLVSHHVKYVHDITGYCVLLHHSVKWRISSIIKNCNQSNSESLNLYYFTGKLSLL